MDQALEGALAARPEGLFDLIGHSFGGCVALRMAVEQPARVRSVTLIEPVMFAAAHAQAQADSDSAMVPVSAALAQGDRAGAARAFHGMWGGGPDWETLPEAARDSMAARIETIPACAPAIRDDVHGVLDRLPPEMPVLLITRAGVEGIMAAIADGLKARMPLLERAEAGRGHMVPMEVPEATARHLTAFWEGAETAV